MVMLAAGQMKRHHQLETTELDFVEKRRKLNNINQIQSVTSLPDIRSVLRSADAPLPRGSTLPTHKNHDRNDAASILADFGERSGIEDGPRLPSNRFGDGMQSKPQFLGPVASMLKRPKDNRNGLSATKSVISSRVSDLLGDHSMSLSPTMSQRSDPQSRHNSVFPPTSNTAAANDDLRKHSLSSSRSLPVVPASSEVSIHSNNREIAPRGSNGSVSLSHRRSCGEEWRPEFEALVADKWNSYPALFILYEQRRALLNKKEDLLSSLNDKVREEKLRNSELRLSLKFQQAAKKYSTVGDLQVKFQQQEEKLKMTDEHLQVLSRDVEYLIAENEFLTQRVGLRDPATATSQLLEEWQDEQRAKSNYSLSLNRVTDKRDESVSTASQEVSPTSASLPNSSQRSASQQSASRQPEAVKSSEKQLMATEQQQSRNLIEKFRAELAKKGPNLVVPARLIVNRAVQKRTRSTSLSPKQVITKRENRPGSNYSSSLMNELKSNRKDIWSNSFPPNHASVKMGQRRLSDIDMSSLRNQEGDEERNRQAEANQKRGSFKAETSNLESHQGLG